MATEPVELLVAAQVSALDENMVEELLAAAPSMVTDKFSLESAARVPPIVNGRPRMLHLDAWIVHEGGNDNGHFFIASDLKKAVDQRKLFEAPYGGVIDFNHDLTPIGYWYAAEYQFDSEAEKYGIKAKGAIWAWLFPEKTDKILAQQEKNGRVDFSMSLLTPEDKMTRFIDAAGRKWTAVHEPTFVAASALDRRPADLDATGTARDEGAAMHDEGTLDLAASNENFEEDLKMDELKTLLADLKADVSEDAITAIVAAVEPVVRSIRDDLDARNTEVETLTSRAESAEAQVKTVEASLEEKALLIETLEAQKGELEAQVAELKTVVDAVEADKKAKAFEELKASRLEQVPEAMRSRVEALPEDKMQTMITAWANLSDEDWTLRLEEFKVVEQAAEATRLPIGSVQDKSSLRDYLRND